MSAIPLHWLPGAVAVVLCLPGAGCQSLEQMAPPVSGARVDAPALEKGRNLFVTRCAACHGVTPVSEYAYAEWQGIVADMAVRSKLAGTEQADILGYLRAVSAR